MGRLGMQGLLQYAPRIDETTATTAAEVELLAQFPQALATFGNGGTDIAFGDGIADADVHGTS
jgi:hypothetical protein